MLHKPWPWTKRLVDRMADSSAIGQLPPRAPRSEGLHASTLLRKLHPVKPRKGEVGITDDQLGVYGLLGLAFEDRAELALISLSKEEDWPWFSFRPGEVEHQGIACSPDILLVPKHGDDPVRELSLKVKWMSCRHVPTETEGENEFDLDKWGYILDQSVCYSTPLDTLGGVLLVYFVNGDYSGARVPQVHGWELDWSLQEQAETWDAVCSQITKA